MMSATDGEHHEDLHRDLATARAEIAKLREIVDDMTGFIRRTATDTYLRSRRAGYHARRVCLEAGAIMADINGTYRRTEAADAARRAAT